MKAAVVLSFVAAAVAGAIEARDGHCGGDNCARQVTGTRDGLSPISSRKNDCSNFMKTTIVPDATYVETCGTRMNSSNRRELYFAEMDLRS